MKKYGGYLKWGLIILIICSILGAKALGMAVIALGIMIIIFMGLGTLFGVLSEIGDSDDAISLIASLFGTIILAIIIIPIVFILVCNACIVLSSIIDKYLIYRLIAIIAVITLIEGLAYFMRYRFNKKNSDKKLELMDKLTMILKDKITVLKLLREYEKFKPLIELLGSCCSSETNKVKLLNNNILKNFLNDEEKFDIDEISKYTVESIEEEISEIKANLRIIEKEFISKSTFEYISDKYSNY